MLDEFSKVIAVRSAVNPIFLTGRTMFRVFAITLCKIVNFSLKGKELSFNSVGVRSIIAFIFAFNFSYFAVAQVEQRVKTPPDVLPVKADTSGINKDTLAVTADTLKRPSDSTIVQPPRGDIETTINYSARDSIRASRSISLPSRCLRTKCSWVCISSN